MDCPFCRIIKGDENQPIICETNLVVSILSLYPVAKYHSLIIPKRHVGILFELTKSEWDDIRLVQSMMKSLIDKTCNPDGYNLGFNVGKAGGQHINHVHYHIIPRFTGDVPQPEGGIRNVIPYRRPYKKLNLSPETKKVRTWSEDLLKIKRSEE